MSLPLLRATRVISALGGSSWPVLAETPSGLFVVKLRGAAQGLLPLIAEIISGEIATKLGLPVPARALVELSESVPTDDRRDELADVLASSHGLNLGFQWLHKATIIRPDQLHLVSEDLAARILWFDGFVANPDRTVSNPNLVISARQPWLIDHGATLSFHYDWRSVTEQSPRGPGPDTSKHLLLERATSSRAIDEELARRLTRAVLAEAVDAVPNDFLAAAYLDQDLDRMRAAYQAYLWKRLATPRPFLAHR